MAKRGKCYIELISNGDHDQSPYCNCNDVANLTYGFNAELLIS